MIRYSWAQLLGNFLLFDIDLNKLKHSFVIYNLPWYAHDVNPNKKHSFIVPRVSIQMINEGYLGPIIFFSTGRREVYQ